MKEWEDLNEVAHKNEIIKREINIDIGEQWYKESTKVKKKYIKESLLSNKIKCKNILEGYKRQNVNAVNLTENFDYHTYKIFSDIENSGALNFLCHRNIDDNSIKFSFHILNAFKFWVENNKGWEVIMNMTSNKKEKLIQRLLDLCGRNICEKHDCDLTFESNAGNGSVDVKLSRGNDKTIIEIKLSSNPNYLHGIETQIEAYANSENTEKKVYLYIKVEEHKDRDKIIEELKLKENKGTRIFIIDALPKKSGSKM